MPQIRLTLLRGAQVRSTTGSQSHFIDVDDLDASQERVKTFIKNYYPQGVMIESCIPPAILEVRMTGLKEVVDADDQLWEDLKSVVAGRPRVV